MTAKSVIKKFTSILWGNTYSAALNLTVASIFISKVGLEEYGKLILLQSIYYAWSYVSKPQTWQAIVKFAPKHGVTQATRTALKIEANAIIYSASIFALIATLAENTYGESLSTAEYILFYAASLALNQGATVGYLRYTSRFNLLSSINSLLATTKLIACLFTQDAIAFFKISLSIDLAIWTLAWLVTIKTTPSPPPSPSPLKKEFSAFSWWGTFNIALDLPVSHLDKIIISYFLGLEAAAAVNLIRRISLVIGQISDPLYHVVLQKFTHLLHEGKRKEAWTIGKKITIITISLAIVASTLSAQLFEVLDRIIFSSKLIDYKFLFSAFLLTYFVGLAFIWIHPFFIIADHMRENSIILFVANSIYILLLVLLSEFGAWGAFLAFSVQVTISIIPKVIYLKYKERT